MTSNSQPEKYTEALRDWMAKRVRAIRVERGLLQKDVAAQANMPAPRLAEIEAGKHHLHGPSLARLLIVYQLHPSEFFAGAPRPPKLSKNPPKPKKET